MDTQTIAHADPFHRPRITSRIPGNGQHRVRLGTGSLRGQRDGRRVTVTAKFDIKDEFRSFVIVVDRLVGYIGEGRIFLTSKYY